MDQPTNTIETWAIVEIMGHTKLAGMAKTEAFGPVMMLRVDVPELPELRKKDKSYYDDFGNYLSTPQDVESVQPAEAAYTRYFGLQAVFSITPCDEPTARAAMDRMRKLSPRTLKLTKALPGAEGGEIEQAAMELSIGGPPDDDGLYDREDL